VIEIQLAKARDAKREKHFSTSVDVGAESPAASSTESPSTLSPAASTASQSTKEWIESLDRDTLRSISILLWHLLYGKLHYPIMDAARLIGNVLGRGEMLGKTLLLKADPISQQALSVGGLMRNCYGMKHHHQVILVGLA